VARVQSPAAEEVDLTLPTRLEPAWQKMAQSPLNGITRPVDIEEEGRGPRRQLWMVLREEEQQHGIS